MPQERGQRDIIGQIAEEKKALRFVFERLRDDRSNYLKERYQDDEPDPGIAAAEASERRGLSPVTQDRLIELHDMIEKYQRHCSKGVLKHPVVETLGYRLPGRTASGAFSNAFSLHYPPAMPSMMTPKLRGAAKDIEPRYRSSGGEVKQAERQMMESLTLIDAKVDEMVPRGSDYNMARQLLIDMAKCNGAFLRREKEFEAERHDEAEKSWSRSHYLLTNPNTLSYPCKLIVQETRLNIEEKIQRPPGKTKIATDKAEAVKQSLSHILKTEKISFYEAGDLLEYCATGPMLSAPERKAHYDKIKAEKRMARIDGRDTKEAFRTPLHEFIRDNDRIIVILQGQIGDFLSAWQGRSVAPRPRPDVRAALDHFPTEPERGVGKSRETGGRRGPVQRPITPYLLNEPDRPAAGPERSDPATATDAADDHRPKILKTSDGGSRRQLRQATLTFDRVPSTIAAAEIERGVSPIPRGAEGMPASEASGSRQPATSVPSKSASRKRRAGQISR